MPKRKDPIDDLIGTEDEALIKLPPGTKRRGRLRPAVNLSAEELRKRARETDLYARGGITISTKIDPALYAEIVELAELHHEPFYPILKQCLRDGVRKYRDLSVSIPGNPFSTPMRSNPEIVHEYDQARAAHFRENLKPVREARAGDTADALAASEGAEVDETHRHIRMVPPRLKRAGFDPLLPQTAIKDNRPAAGAVAGDAEEELPPGIPTDEEIERLQQAAT